MHHNCTLVGGEHCYICVECSGQHFNIIIRFTFLLACQWPLLWNLISTEIFQHKNTINKKISIQPKILHVMNNGTVHNVMYTSIVCHVCLWYWPHTVTGEWHVFFVNYNLAICDSIILQQLQSTSVLPVLQHLIQWTSDCLFRQIESRLIQLIIIDNNMFTIPIITWAVSEKKFDPSLLVRSLFYLRTSRPIIPLQGIYHFCSSEDRCCCSIYHVTAGVRDVMLNILHDNVDMQNTLTHAVWQNYSLTK